MNIGKFVVLTISIVGILSLIVASQISQVTNAISIEESQSCNTIFYDDIQPIYGTCINYINYTSCLNTSGPNTDCSLNQVQLNFSCQTGSLVTPKNLTECKPLNKFILSIDKGAFVDKKEVDFSSWGICINSTENNCSAIICGSLQGGSARNGVFNGCDGGKSCQKFLFCQDGVKILYKASREDFVEEDPTFHLSKLAYKEVGQ
ncbi:MAG: hypothetical protein Q8R04_02280 [Nanoarchaeota archaeon]|nr:hypothetical protein [Nanoarchaeota archaeon]